MSEAEPVLLDTDTLSELSRGNASAGKPFHRQLHAFEALVQNSVVLPFDENAAAVSSTIWATSFRAQRQKLGDILIAGIAVARQIPLATRNQRDFEVLRRNAEVSLHLVDWTARAKQVGR